MNWQDYIISTEYTLAGKPRIKGTRLSIEFLVGRLADGWTEEEILENYPTLTRAALQAVYSYVFAMMQDGMMYLPTTKNAA